MKKEDVEVLMERTLNKVKWLLGKVMPAEAKSRSGAAQLLHLRTWEMHLNMLALNWAGVREMVRDSDLTMPSKSEIERTIDLAIYNLIVLKVEMLEASECRPEPDIPKPKREDL